MTFPWESINGSWYEVWAGRIPLNGNMVLPYLLTYSKAEDSGPHNMTFLFMLYSGKTRATCLSGTFWATVSKFKLSGHVVYMISAQEQVSLNPQGIWVTWVQNEKQTWLQVLSACSCITNSKVSLISIRNLVGSSVHKAVLSYWFLVKRASLLPLHTFKHTYNSH